MGDVFTGTQTTDVPSEHPGLLCSKNTPAELKQLVGGVDTCEGACYLNLEEVPHIHAHTFSNDVPRDFCSYKL